jgi:origin recognition complex subunit 4
MFLAFFSRTPYKYLCLYFFPFSFSSLALLYGICSNFFKKENYSHDAALTGKQQLFTDAIFQRQYISSIYYTTKSIPTLLSGLLIPTSTLTTFPNAAHYVQNVVSLTPLDSNLSLLSTLSSLALSLLISAARLTIIHSTESLNFNLAYGEYVSLASKARINSAAAGQLASGSRLWGKDVARKEWEGLVELGLILQTGGVGEMCRVDVALEEIPGAAGEGVLGKVREKWCKQI